MLCQTDEEVLFYFILLACVFFSCSTLSSLSATAQTCKKKSGIIMGYHTNITYQITEIINYICKMWTKFSSQCVQVCMLQHNILPLHWQINKNILRHWSVCFSTDAKFLYNLGICIWYSVSSQYHTGTLLLGCGFFFSWLWSTVLPSLFNDHYTHTRIHNIVDWTRFSLNQYSLLFQLLPRRQRFNLRH